MAIIQVEHPKIDPSSFEPQNRKPGISGLIRVRNEGEFLAQVIKSWINYVDELVIIFHQCTDNTPQIIETYEKRYAPKIRAYHYLPHVYALGTQEQVELDVDNIHSFIFYSNFGLSQTQFQTCVKIDGDHIGIAERLKTIYEYLHKKPISNQLLFFSGVDLRHHPDDHGKYYIDLNAPAMGDGDHAYWPVSPQNIFIKHPTAPYWEFTNPSGLEPYYLGFIFWHTHELKRVPRSPLGDSLRGQPKQELYNLLLKKETNRQLAPLSPQIKQRYKDFQNIATKHFSIYFDFGSLPYVRGVYHKPVLEALHLAAQYEQANHLSQAEELYRQVLAYQIDHPEALYGLARLEEQKNNLPIAEQLLNQVLQIQPNSAEAWFSLGNLQETQRNLEAAIGAYQQALKLRPGAFPIYHNLGYIYQQQQQWSRAVAYYRKALELQPKCIEAEAGLGYALYELGKLPDEQRVHYATVNHQLSKKYQQAKDIKSERECLHQAKVLMPTSSKALV